MGSPGGKTTCYLRSELIERGGGEEEETGTSELRSFAVVQGRIAEPIQQEGGIEVDRI